MGKDSEGYRVGIYRRWEGGHHPSDHALFSQGVLWGPQPPPGLTCPTCSLSSAQHDLPTHAALPAPHDMTRDLIPSPSHPPHTTCDLISPSSGVAPSCYASEAAFPSLWNAVPALSFLLKRPTLSSGCSWYHFLQQLSGLFRASEPSACPLPVPISPPFYPQTPPTPTGLPGLEAKSCSLTSSPELGILG